MSSTRRSANEINILAMLDRRQSAGLAQRMLRGLRSMPALLWYGTAGVLVAGLVGTLAWLAGDGSAPFPAAAALAGVTGAAEPAAEPLPAGGATIVEVAPAAVAAPVTKAVAVAPAPARALPPQQHAGRIVPREARRAPQGLAAHAAAKPAPRPVAARPPAHAETRRGRQAPSAKTAQDAIDTDVALISAIIQHAGKRQEAEDAASKP